MIKFFTQEGKSASEIEVILEKHYGAGALKLPTVYKWMQRFACGQESVKDNDRSGRPLDEEITNSIQKELDEDPLASARSIALRLGISDWLVRDRLHNVLKYRNLRTKLVPHFLTPEQKSVRVKYSKSMLKELKKHSASGFKYVLTGDESWFYFRYDVKTQWVLSSEDLIERESPNLRRQKMMLTLFVSGEGPKLIVMKDEDQKINAEYFIANVLSYLTELCDEEVPPVGLNWLIHFDNARPHTAKKVNDFLEGTTLKKLLHPPYSPDLAHCDFGIFGTVKQKLVGIECTTCDELKIEITKILEEFNGQKMKEIYLCWMRRLKQCIDMDGDYIE